ncbi:MAG: hypothetical protein KF816_06370 [Melioribacteraceae bacterium]|nr:hypothetical protein [Melioribacteraceae bacterium]
MDVKIVSVENHNNLAVVQFASSFIDTFDYISLSEAMADKLIEINEIDESGNVNKVRVMNHSTKHVFMMDGDIITGAKQNRVVNSSILVPPMNKIFIDVSCVEEGRWSKTSTKFKDEVFCAPPSIRSKKSKSVLKNLKEEKGHLSDQSMIWESVERAFHAFDLSSKTSSLTSIHDVKGKDFEIEADKFTLDTRANGIGLFHYNKFIGLDLFNSSKVYAEYFEKLVKGAVWEIESKTEKGDPTTEAEVKYRTLELLDNIDNYEKEEFPGIGVGTEKRFQNEEVTGFELSLEEKTIHLTVLTSERSDENINYNKYEAF